MKRLLRSVPAVVLVLAAFGASAALAQSSEAPSPVGAWRTIDDKTGDPRSIVEIYEEDGALHGRVVEILKVGSEAERNSAGQVICDACEGDKKGQPIEGMVILEGLNKDGDEWSGGTILDPSNGKRYKAKVELDGDDRLDVRGYLGMPLFGRTQTWQRVTERK
jgi:uncharacterized protein (DUF2147 family)